MGHYLEQYWAWVGGNVGAMPLQAVITVLATLALRKPLGRLYHHVVGDKLDIEDVRAVAASAHRIAADLYEHVTGEQHPEAPQAPEA